MKREACRMKKKLSFLLFPIFMKIKELKFSENLRMINYFPNLKFSKILIRIIGNHIALKIR